MDINELFKRKKRKQRRNQNSIIDIYRKQKQIFYINKINITIMVKTDQKKLYNVQVVKWSSGKIIRILKTSIKSVKANWQRLLRKMEGLTNPKAISVHGEQFYEDCIKPKFDFHSYVCQYTMPWNFIDNTNYQTYSVIILIKCYDLALSVLHYMVIIGKSNDGKKYLLFDNSQQIYLVSSSQLRRAMKIDTPTVYNYNAYRVG